MRVLELAGIVGVGYLGLRIQNAVGEIRLEQSRVKAELVDGQTRLREDFDEKHAENSQNIAVHEASDIQKFEAIKNTLERIERKIDNGHAHR